MHLWTCELNISPVYFWLNYLFGQFHGLVDFPFEFEASFHIQIRAWDFGFWMLMGRIIRSIIQMAMKDNDHFLLVVD
jgi:hypothetical protein